MGRRLMLVAVVFMVSAACGGDETGVIHLDSAPLVGHADIPVCPESYGRLKVLYQTARGDYSSLDIACGLVVEHWVVGDG